MKKYFVIDDRGTELWGNDEPLDTEEEALAEAEFQFSGLTHQEKMKTDFYVLYGEMDEDGICFEGDVIKNFSTEYKENWSK